MFVIGEVHPYSDGNGRVARALMNAALVAAERTELPLGDYAATTALLEATGAMDESGDRRLRSPSELG